MRLHRAVAVTAAALLAGPMMVGTAQAAPTAPAKTWSPTLISAEPLYDGSAVRLRYTEGVTVVASAGAKVIFTGSGTSTTTDGQRTYDRAVQVVDPHAISKSSSSAATAAYSAAGRSVYSDAIAAGFTPAEARRQAQPKTAQAEPPISASGCVYSETSQPDPTFEWSGCYKLYSPTPQDTRAWYVAGSGTAHGWGTGVLGGGKELQKGFSEITWVGAGAEIIEASPSGNQSGSNCRSVSISLAQIIGLSYQVPLCNDGWDVTWNRNLHKVEWHGASTRGQSDSRSAANASTVRMPLSTPSVTLSYRIGWTYACYC